jgi:hypothetical protein
MPVPAGTGFCCPGGRAGIWRPCGVQLPERAGAAAPGEGECGAGVRPRSGGFWPGWERWTGEPQRKGSKAING